MDWIISVGGSWLITLKWLVGMALGFGLLARLMPCNPGMYWWKSLRGTITDLMYWFVMPLALGLGRTWMMVCAVTLVFGGWQPEPWLLKTWPLGLQCLAILLVQDVILYAIHRLFHTRLGWRFHAIHHSPEVLDWTATARFHPVNNLLEFAVADIAVLLMGFSPEALFALVPFNTIYSALVHANLNWTFGPLRYVLASPVFHRWHHTTEEAGLNKNFASTFPVLDVLFGSFYMPAGQLPEKFGNGEPDFPEGFWAQLVYPFRMGQRPAAAPAPEKRPLWKAAAILAMIGLAGGSVYVGLQLTDRNREMAEELARMKFQQQLAGPEQAMQFGLAAQAWAENDLARATAFLDQLTATFAPTTPLPTQLRELRELCQRKCRGLKGHTGAVLAVAVSGDGRRIVTGGQDGTVRTWDAATGQPERTLAGHNRAVLGVALSADGQHIVSGSHDCSVKVWNALTGQLERTLSGHGGAVLGVAISRDGRRVVSGGTDWTVRVWNTATGQEERSFSGQTAAVLSVALSGDGRRVAWANGWSVKIGDADTGREERTLQGHADLVYRVALAPDGKRTVSGSFDGNVKVWNATNGLEELTLKGHTGPVYGVAISTDEKRIVSGSQDQTIKVWDVATGREELTLKGHADAVSSVAIDGDGRRIVSGSHDGTAKSWDTEECKRTRH